MFSLRLLWPAVQRTDVWRKRQDLMRLKYCVNLAWPVSSLDLPLDDKQLTETKHRAGFPTHTHLSFFLSLLHMHIKCPQTCTSSSTLHIIQLQKLWWNHTWLLVCIFPALSSVAPVDKWVPTEQEARISSQQPNFSSNTNIYTPAKLMFQHKFDLLQHQAVREQCQKDKDVKKKKKGNCSN